MEKTIPGVAAIAGKWMVLIGITLLAISCVGSREALKEVREMPIAHIEISTIPDGSYEGSFSYSNTMQRVRVRVTDGRITAIDVLEGSESRHGLQGRTVLERVIAEQRVDVEAVSGATTTSKAYLKAVEKALADN